MGEKILLTSDWHKTSFKKKKFETQKWSLGEWIIQLLGGSGFSKIMLKMKKVVESFNIRIMIHNGDLQENTHNERGMVTNTDLESAETILHNAEESYGVEILLNAGNHETGYHKSAQPLATDDYGGISQASIQNFLELTKRSTTYHSFEVGKYIFAFIPYLLTETTAKDFDLSLEKEKVLNQFEQDLLE